MAMGEKKSSSGMIFFIVVLAVLACFLLFARQDFSIPSIDSNSLSPQNLLSLDSNSPSSVSQAVVPEEVTAFFCPQDSCAEQLIQHIDSSQKSIHMAIYSFTHDGIADALIRARQRGVDVKVVFDSDESKISSSVDERIQMAGISIARRNGPGYMHNKFTVIDGNIVATGSFNYSQNADTKNDENLIFIASDEIASKFSIDFDILWAVSDKA